MLHLVLSPLLIKTTDEQQPPTVSPLGERDGDRLVHAEFLAAARVEVNSCRLADEALTGAGAPPVHRRPARERISVALPSAADQIVGPAVEPENSCSCSRHEPRSKAGCLQRRRAIET